MYGKHSGRKLAEAWRKSYLKQHRVLKEAVFSLLGAFFGGNTSFVFQ